MGGFYAYSSFNCFECIMNTVIWQIIVLQKKKKKRREEEEGKNNNKLYTKIDTKLHEILFLKNKNNWVGNFPRVNHVLYIVRCIKVK